MKSHTLSEANNHKYIGHTKKMDANVPNISELEYNGSQDGVYINFI